MNDVIVIGAGLTGLTLAYRLKRTGVDVRIVERSDRTGGQIASHSESGFLFESGPNTGTVSSPEVAELFADLKGACTMETAGDGAGRRLIWCRGKLRPLPYSHLSGITTPLFTPLDKLRLLGEPWRRRGDDPDESIADMVRRRLGKSFLDYAVDPFIGGIYAGDPSRLVTRYALPKLYRLEQEYGSFIRGAITKAKEPKSDRDRLVTKKIFSVRGGMEALCKAMTEAIGTESITLSARNVEVTPTADGMWRVECDKGSFGCRYAVTTVGSYELPRILKWIPESRMESVANLEYAPVVQVSVGVADCKGRRFDAFGALMPSRERRAPLGILFPSGCFKGRAPEGGALFSFFIGGVRGRSYFGLDDNELTGMVRREMHDILGLDTEPDLIRIWRHEHAIPQYYASTGRRLEAVAAIESENRGLILAGNLRDGIGMSDRIRQGCLVAERIIGELNGGGDTIRQ